MLAARWHYYDIFMLAVDPGALHGAWVDCKHKYITNEALFFPLYTSFFTKYVVISYSSGLDNTFEALCRILPSIIFVYM